MCACIVDQCMYGKCAYACVCVHACMHMYVRVYAVWVIHNANRYYMCTCLPTCMYVCMCASMYSTFTQIFLNTELCLRNICMWERVQDLITHLSPYRTPSNEGWMHEFVHENIPTWSFWRVVCVCVCMCVCVCVCHAWPNTFVWNHVHKSVYVHVRVNLYTHAWTYICMYVCMHTCIYVRIIAVSLYFCAYDHVKMHECLCACEFGYFMRIHTCMHACEFIPMRVCLYVYASYTQTQTHTQTTHIRTWSCHVYANTHAGKYPSAQNMCTCTDACTRIIIIIITHVCTYPSP